MPLKTRVREACSAIWKWLCEAAPEVAIDVVRFFRSFFVVLDSSADDACNKHLETYPTKDVGASRARLAYEYALKVYEERVANRLSLESRRIDLLKLDAALVGGYVAINAMVEKKIGFADAAGLAWAGAAAIVLVLSGMPRAATMLPAAYGLRAGIHNFDESTPGSRDAEHLDGLAVGLAHAADGISCDSAFRAKHLKVSTIVLLAAAIAMAVGLVSRA